MPLEQGAIEGFAHEITRRAALTPAPENRTTTDEALEKSLTEAVSFVEENFGDRAARTFMGVVLQNAGSKPLGEDDLGNALVDGLEFIDRAFGIAAGDKAMSFFNGELNQAINGYFQNGKNESFLAMDLDQASDKLGEAMGQAVSAMMDKFAAKVDPNAMLMDQARKDQDETLDSQAEPGEEYPADGTDGEGGALLDENGMPVAEATLTGELSTEAAVAAGTSDAAGTATGETQAQEQAARKAQAGTKRRMRSGRKSRRSRQEASNAANAYDQSGIKPGVVLDKKI
ncbi:MAG: hypothetical protein ACLGSA_11690 [Acidobacteriota bacterium]